MTQARRVVVGGYAPRDGSELAGNNYENLEAEKCSALTRHKRAHRLVG